MDLSQNNAPVRDFRKTTSILFVAMLGALIAYAVVAAVIMAEPVAAPMDPEMTQTLRLVFLILAAASTVASLVIPRLIEAGSQGHPDQRYLTGRILAWGFSESIALFGLVGAFLGFGSDLVWLLIAWAALALLFHAPRSRRRPV